MAIQNSDLLVIQQTASGQIRKATVSALLANVPSAPNGINDLTDVDTSAVTDGQMLVYSTDTWTTQDIPAGVDLSNYLQKPGSEGEYLVVESDTGAITYSPSTALQPGEAATPEQGAKADTATQPGDDNTTLNNAAGYITAADIPPIPALDYVPLGSWAALPAV